MTRRAGASSSGGRFDPLLADAMAAQRAGRLADAEALYRQVLAATPGNAQALNLLGAVLGRTGRGEEGLALVKRAIARDKRNPVYRASLGTLLLRLGRPDPAIAAFRAALKLAPDLAAAHNNLGVAYKETGRVVDAIDAYRRAVGLADDYAEAWSNLGNALTDMNAGDEAESAYGKALSLRPDDATAHSNLLLSLNYRADIDEDRLFAAHRDWAARHAGPVTAAAAPHRRDSDPERRLRIGYVSADFRVHSVSFFLTSFLSHHDRDAVEVFGYAAVANPDTTTVALRAACDHWRDIRNLDDDAAAAAIRADRIDILVDLGGHTRDNRLPLFAQRPAPVQVAWLGYPATTGMTAMDWRLTDAVADPPGAADSHYSERLVRLDDGFLCYASPTEAPAVAPPPSETAGYVTFASFNNFAKTGPDVLAAWARILEAVPESRLLLKTAIFTDTRARREIGARLAEAGLPSGRVTLLARQPDRGDHLTLYGRADIALDTFPYNGTTTTCEALWMGVPVVTLAGDRHAGRVGASLLAGLGLADLVAADAEDYVAVAAALAENGARRAALRAGLRDRMAASALCDGPGFARRIEAAYRDIWRHWCDQTTP